MLELYKNIKKYRLEMKLSQSELAKRTGYTDRSSIAKIEKGDVDLPQSKIMIFASALNVSPGVLMGDTGIEPASHQTHNTIRSDESQLLNNYNLLNETGKEKAQDSVHDLTEIKRYRKDNKVASFPVLNAAHERTDIDVTDEMLQYDDDIMDNDDEW